MNKHSHRIRVACVATTLGTAFALASSTVSTASTTNLTATAIRITAHPAYVEADVEFTGAGLTAGQFEATDPGPTDGSAMVLVSAAHPGAAVASRRAHGITVQLVTSSRGLRVGIASTRGAFKYLAYHLVGGNRLVIFVWKSRFAPSGNVHRSAGGCLTLSAVSAAPGAVTATGTAHGLFESRFRAVLRDGTGHILASRAVIASGRWKLTLRYAAVLVQAGSFEASVASAKDGALSCLVQKALTLPASSSRVSRQAM
jgi:hypothetical protein